jgi:hypothetical protein
MFGICLFAIAADNITVIAAASQTVDEVLVSGGARRVGFGKTFCFIEGESIRFPPDAQISQPGISILNSKRMRLWR